MDPTESIALDFLRHSGYRDIVYEPDGNVPPDFLIDNGIAMEVRRLNQHANVSGVMRGLEVTEIPLLALLGLEERPPRWASWQDRFVFTTAFLHWADTASARPLSAYALGTQGREFLERFRSALEHDLVIIWSAHTKIQNWPAFLGQAVHELASWMEEMA